MMFGLRVEMPFGGFRGVDGGDDSAGADGGGGTA